MGEGTNSNVGRMEIDSGAERRSRAKIYDEMKEMARKAGFKDARIVIKENG